MNTKFSNAEPFGHLWFYCLVLCSSTPIWTVVAIIEVDSLCWLTQGEAYCGCSDQAVILELSFNEFRFFLTPVKPFVAYSFQHSVATQLDDMFTYCGIWYIINVLKPLINTIRLFCVILLLHEFVLVWKNALLSPAPLSFPACCFSLLFAFCICSGCLVVRRMTIQSFWTLLAGCMCKVFPNHNNIWELVICRTLA